MFPHNLHSNYAFMAGILHWRCCVLLRTSHLEACDVHLPFVGDTNFVQLVKDIAGFLHHIVTIFLFATNKQSLWWYFETMKMSCFLIKLITPHSCFSISQKFLHVPVFTLMIAEWWFSKWTLLPPFTSWHSAFYYKQKPHLLFIYLLLSVDSWILFLQSFIILHCPCLFWCSDCPDLASKGHLSWLLGSYIFPSFSEDFFISSRTEDSRLILALSCPSLEISHFSKEPWFVLMGGCYWRTRSGY